MPIKSSVIFKQNLSLQMKNMAKKYFCFKRLLRNISWKWLKTKTGKHKHKGRQGAGRPKLIWKKLTERDCREWKLTTVDPQERSTWRSGVRSAMRAASQLPGKGPTDVDDAPAPAR